MRHFASPAFWHTYRRLPQPVRRLADHSFEVMKTNPRYPGLHLKRIASGSGTERSVSTRTATSFGSGSAPTPSTIRCCASRVTPRGAVFAFRDNVFANPPALVREITGEGSMAKLRPDQRVVFIRDWVRAEERLKGVATILTRLARMAEEGRAAA